MSPLSKKSLFITSLVTIVAACGGLGGGGGGGGSGANYEGDLYLELERDQIDSGDLDKVNIEVANLNPHGAILKVRMPLSLRYVQNSAVMFPGRDERRPISPDRSVADDNQRFLVFFLDPREAIDQEYVSLQFTVKALAGDEDGYVEIDLDNNDPSIPDSREFSLDDPNFTAKDRRSIYVQPESSIAPKTPTPTASGTTTPTVGATPTAKK